MNSTSRRAFLKQAAGAVGVGLARNLAIAAPLEAADWSIPLLGDLHFDRPEHHDFDWLRREHPNDLKQVENYCRITAERTPALLEKVAAACQQLKQAGKTVPFVLQLGDLLEGLCGSEPLARRQATEAIELLEQARLSVPVVLTKGNHDITGPGAPVAYADVLLAHMAKATKAHLTQAAFTQAVGGALLVFYDAYDRRSLDWFSGVLQQQRPSRLVVAIHPPVVPYNARSTWHVYSSARQQPDRARMLELLGRHQAIVLSGHLHKYSFLARRTESGRFVQLAISSVASTSDGRPKDELKGTQHYTPDLVDLEPRHSPETIAVRRAMLAAERPYVEHFEYAESWGRATLHLQQDKATVDVFRGFDERPWKQLEL